MQKTYITALFLLISFVLQAQNLKSKYYQDSVLVDSTATTKGYTANFSGGGTSNNYVPDVIPPSPNAASMGRFGDIALNLSSGLPNLPIPIYTANERSISVPIGLQYRYTGFRPSEDGGVLGRGFSLNAGGIITRTQKGAWHDEKIISASGHQGGYLTSGYATAQVIDPITGLWICTPNTCPYPFGQFENLYDGEPDMFNFSFGNVSGKFFFGADGLIKIVSDQKLKIEYVWNKNTVFLVGQSYQNLTNWTITTEDGTKYRFGFTGANPINVDLSYSTVEHTISAWHLYEIEAQTGEKVKFTYLNDHVSTTDILKIHASFSMTQNYVSASDGSQYQESSPTPFLSRSAETFLKTIEGTNWIIDFTHQEYNAYYQAGSISGYSYIKLLQSIKISAKTSPLTTLKSFDFTYNSTNTKALLTSIQPKDSQGSIAVPAHTFEYYNNTIPSAVTAFSTSIDYWNYYNGASNSTLLPQFGANRNPDLASTRVGAMKKIIYPTGGTTEFEYELNEFGYIRENAIPSNRGTIGGLRVSKIIDTPVIGTPVIKKYQYNDFGNTARSSGVVEEITVPYSLNATIAVSCNDDLPTPWYSCPPNNRITYTVFKSEPFYQMSREPVYYYNVRELINSDSRSDHVFTSHLDFPDFLGHPYGLGNSSIGPVSSRDFARGLPKNIKYYKNSTDLISEKKYKYSVTDRYLSPTFYIGTAFVRNGSGENIVYSKGLNTYSGWLRRVSEISIFYNGASSTETKEVYEYNPSYQIYKKTSTEGKSIPIIFGSGDVIDSRAIETTTFYPADFPNDPVLTAMAARNILNPVVERKTESQSFFDSGINELLANIDYEKTTYSLFGNAYLPAKIETKIGDGVLQTAIDFLSYDARGNLLKYKTRGGQTTTLTWYNSTDLGKADLLKSHTVGGGATGTVLSRSMTYDYKPLVGLSIATDLNSYAVSYQYDNFSRLISIKDPQNYLLKDLNYHYANQTALSGLGVTPTNTMNYVLSRTARVEQTGAALDSDVDKTTTQLQYLDGLGRNLQRLTWKATPDKTKDILSETALYDAYGRAYKSILPTPSDVLTGEYKSNAENLASTFYGDTSPSTETVFESSPLNRPLKQFGAGQAWRTADKYVSMEYRIAGSEVVRFDVNVSGNGVTASKYPANSLYNHVVLSERGFWTLEEKDRQGKVVAKYQQLEGNFVFMITGYCYDDLGRLKYVIPPEVYKQFAAGTLTGFTENDVIFKEGIYGYHYDNLGRLNEKHIPGARWKYSVFDKQDREVMFADDSDLSKGYWQFRKFDALGRIVVSGIKTGIGSVSRATLQTAFDAMTTETYEETGTALLGYTNRSFPTAYAVVDADVREVIYYDDYGFNSDVAYNFQSANAFHAQGLTKGLMTGMLIRNLETNVWYKSVNYFDYKSRPIQSFSQNHLGGIDRSEYQYRFNGEVLKMRMMHQGIKELCEYSYNHAGLKTSFTHNSQVVAKYEYDAINRLQAKKFKPVGTSQGSKQTGNWTDASSWLSGLLPLPNDNVTINTGHTLTIPNGQIASAGVLNDKGILRNFGTLNMGRIPNADLYVETFKYHIRGGLKEINTDANGNLTNVLFSFKLAYEDGTNGGYFDGNIRNQYWKSSIDGVQRAYEYSYDGASRITGATYAGKAGENYALENMSYDFNGNLTNMWRKGKIGANTWDYIDKLSYVYQANSNKIQAVNDALLVSNPNVGDFRDSSSTATQYTYNQDGSLNSDDNKKITFEWNYLKSPKKITKANGQWKKFQYDATGKLLRTETSTGITTDFVGNLTYENNALYQIAHDEGRVMATGSYEYDIYDHAKNLRVSFRDSSGIAKIVTKLDYDPWGYRLKGLDYYRNYQTYNKFNTFSGKQLHDDFGFNLLSYKFRFHDPAIGRFISIDPLAEEFSYNSTFAFAENKLGLGVEYEGLELVANPWNLSGTGNRYTYSGSSSNSGSKLGVSANASVGLQVGAVEKVWGMGVGAYANAGSVEVGNIQMDAIDGSKGELATEKGNLTIKQGGEVALGVIGFEGNKDRNFTENGNKLEVKSSIGFSIGPVKISNEKVESFEKNDGKYVSKGANSNTIVTFAETKSTNAFIVKGEVKAEASIGISPYKVVDNRPWETRTDATRVSNNKVSLPIKTYPQF